MQIVISIVPVYVDYVQCIYNKNRKIVIYLLELMNVCPSVLTIAQNINLLFIIPGAGGKVPRTIGRAHKCLMEVFLQCIQTFLDKHICCLHLGLQKQAMNQ